MMLFLTLNNIFCTMEEYRKHIQYLAKNHIGRTFMNSDEEHAAIVLNSIFKTATTTVRIFAGNLCHHVGTTPGYIESLSDFIDRGGEVRMLLNNCNDEDLRGSNLFKRLAYYKSIDKPVFIKKTSKKVYLTKDPDRKEVHFTVGDQSSFRLETDITKRSAIGDFNNAIAEKYASFFDRIFTDPESVEIDIVNLVANGN